MPASQRKVAGGRRRRPEDTVGATVNPMADRPTAPTGGPASGGRAASGRSPRPVDAVERRCIASGEIRPKAELLRFAADPEGRVVPDVAGRLPGRGLWLLPRRDMLEKARKRKLFARAARAPLQVPEDLAAQVEAQLVCRCLELLGLACRAGQTVAGYEKVAARLTAGRVALLFEASDAAEGGPAKLRALARRQGRMPGIVRLFTAAELGSALGLGARVHVAVAPGGLASRLAAETARLAAWRGLSGDADGEKAGKGGAINEPAPR